MQKDSRKDIDRFLGLDRKRNGAELKLTSRMENGIVSLRTWWSTSVRADIPCCADPALWNEVLWKQRRWTIVNAFRWWSTNCWSGFSHYYFCDSAQCLRSRSGYVRRTGLENLWLFKKLQGNLLLRTIPRPWWCQQNGRQLTRRLGPMRLCIETCCTIMNESQMFQIIFNWSNCAPMQVSRKLWRGTVFHDPRRCGTWQIGWLVSRVHKKLLRDNTLSNV